MNSFWIKNFKNNAYPTLEKNSTVDVCIIGGGITSISCGYYLSKNNLKVCILEKDKIMQKTSGHTTAKITSQHGLFYKYLYDSYGKDLAKKYLESNEEAISNIKNIIDLENIDCDFEYQSHYVYTTDKNNINKIKDEVETLKKLNYNANFLDKISIPIPNVKAAIEFEHQAQFNPIKYTQGLCDVITNNSGLIFEHSKVEKLEKYGKEYRIHCNDKIITAKNVIIATRYPVINFPGFHFLKMYSEASYIIGVETASELSKGMYISNDTPSFSFKTAILNGKRILLVGGMNHKRGAKIDLSNSYNILEEKVKELYPDAKVLYKWNTHDSISLDKIPYIGDFSCLYPNVYLATGFKKWGMTTSNVAANIITDKILGKENKYEEIYNSKRFAPIKNRKELGNMLKETSHSLIFNKLDMPSAKPKDVEPGEGKVVNYNGKKVGLYKDKNGKEYKVIPTCAHLGCELSWNNLDKTWDCPCHGSRYTYEGKLIYGPSKKDLKVIE